MKNIALIAGLNLALATTALADNGSWMTSSPELTYSHNNNNSPSLPTNDGTMKLEGVDLKTWGWSYYYDLKSRDSAIVVTKPIFTATNLFGVRNLNMSVEGFGGVGLETGKLIGGVAGIFRGKVADQIWLGVGPGVTAQDGRPLGFGVLGQIQVRF